MIKSPRKRRQMEQKGMAGKGKGRGRKVQRILAPRFCFFSLWAEMGKVQALEAATEDYIYFPGETLCIGAVENQVT